MYSTQSDCFAIAQTPKYLLEQRSNTFLPYLKPLVSKTIKVERVGFTRNASHTPYLVYRVNNRRCCTFIKRRWLFELVQTLLTLVKGIEVKITKCTSSESGGLIVKTDMGTELIASSYINKFCEDYNKAAFACVEPERRCDLLFGFCRHTIIEAIARAWRGGKIRFCTESSLQFLIW